MIDPAQQRAELLAVIRDATDRRAADADAVIAALAPDKPGSFRIAPCLMIGECDLQRGIDRFGTGIAEKHVIQVAGE